MVKKGAKKTGDIIVTIARFGQNPQNVTVAAGSTVGDAIKAAGITVKGRETMFVEGEDATRADILENGDILSIVSPKEAGVN